MFGTERKSRNELLSFLKEIFENYDKGELADFLKEFYAKILRIKFKTPQKDVLLEFEFVKYTFNLK